MNIQKRVLQSKTVLVAGIIAAVCAVSSVAFAQTSTTTTTTASSTSEMSVTLRPNGNAAIGGVITSISSGSIMVNSWGGNWIVKLASSTRTLPNVAGGGAMQFSVGDSVNVTGTTSINADWTVNAETIRDSSYNARVIEQKKDNQQAVKDAEASGTKAYMGTASAVNNTSFTLTPTKGTAQYTVNDASTTLVVNRNWITIPFSSIKNPDTVRVYGLADASSTINARIILDESITATSTEM